MGEVRMTSGLLFVSVALWCFMFCLSKPIVLYNKPGFGGHISRNFNLYFFIFFLFSVLGFSGYDTYHTWQDFLTIKNSNNLTHYEPIYRWFADLSGMRYFAWRAIVWGIAVGSLYFLVRLLKDKTFGMMFSIAILLPFSYFVETRGSSAHSLALLGVSLLFGSEKLFKRRIFIALVLITISFFFHRSNFMFIGLLLASFFLPFEKKWFIILSLLLFPFLLAVVTNILNSFVSGGMEIAFGDNMNIQDKALSYASGEKAELNAMGILGVVINKAPLILITFLLLVRVSFQGFILSGIYNFFFKATYLAMYIGLLFAFQETSSWLFERILFMATFPMCFVFSNVMKSEKKNSMMFKCVYIGSLISIAYSLLHKFYVS